MSEKILHRMKRVTELGQFQVPIGIGVIDYAAWLECFACPAEIYLSKQAGDHLHVVAQILIQIRRQVLRLCSRAGVLDCFKLRRLLSGQNFGTVEVFVREILGVERVEYLEERLGIHW